MASIEVGAEWKCALKNSISVIPVYLRSCEDIPYRLEQLQYIDFRKGGFDDNVKPLIETLRKPIYSPGEEYAARVGDDPAPYVADLKDESWHVRLDAVDALLLIGGAAGLIALTQVLSTEQHSCVRERIITGLSARPSEGLSPKYRRLRLGTGIYRNVITSEGLVPLSEEMLRTYYTKIQTIDFDLPMRLIIPFDLREKDRRKVRAAYKSGAIWLKVNWSVVAATAGSEFVPSTLILTIHRDGNFARQVHVGELDLKLLAKNAQALDHGFICQVPISVGDEFYAYTQAEWRKYFDGTSRTMMQNPCSESYACCEICLGADLYYHYDSFIYRRSVSG